MWLYKVKRKVLCGYPDITNSYICVASNMVEAFDLRKQLCFEGELGDVCFEELAYNMKGPARSLSSSCSACRSH